MSGKRIKAYDRNQWNDMRYRGPLSYRHLLIFGWLCISFRVLAVIFQLGINMDPHQPAFVYAILPAAEAVGSLALPLFLLANFAIILDRKYTYKQQLIKFGGLSLLVIFLFVLIKEHYLGELLGTFLEDRAAADRILDDLLLSASMDGSMIFNLFIDMFMCTLLMCFLNYEPKRIFTGKKLTIFRLFSLLPVLYEAGSLAVRICMAFGVIRPASIILPCLTTKPFMSFILFVILAMHIKFMERRFKKHGKTREEYKAYIQTRAHSFGFSVYTSIMILITSAVDTILYLVSTVAIIAPDLVSATKSAAPMTEAAASSGAAVMTEAAGLSDAALEQVMNANLDRAMRTVDAWGIGKHTIMIVLIPVVLLFSYTRTHKNQNADIAIPVGGVILAVFVAVETIHQGIIMNLPFIMKTLQQMASSFAA